MSQPSRIQVIEQSLVANRGKLLGVLVRLLGTQHYELVEDIIQDVWLKAFSHWQASGLPDEPSAWLITVAKRTALDALRAQKVRQKYADSLTEPLTSEWTVASTVEKAFDSQLYVDDELRLLFWLSSTDMPQQSRLPLVLKTLCGLDANAVSRALLLPLETVKKRLVSLSLSFSLLVIINLLFSNKLFNAACIIVISAVLFALSRRLLNTLSILMLCFFINSPAFFASASPFSVKGTFFQPVNLFSKFH